MRNQSVINNIDWIIILLYIVLVCLGWVNIYSASLPIDQTDFDFSQIYGKQLILIILCIPLIFIILTLEAKIYERFASVFYALSLLSLAGLFVFGKTIKGQTNWYAFGSFSIQPSEFVKVTIALALAKYLSDIQVNLNHVGDQVKAFLIIGIPILLILGQPDAGSAIILLVFVLVLYREGLPSWFLWVGSISILLFILSLVTDPIFIILGTFVISLFFYFKGRKPHRNPILIVICFLLTSGFVFIVDYVFDNVLQKHQQDRLNILLGKEIDLQGIGYNTNQAQIAIGSGGWIGKGFLEGTQTKGDFVPEQHTDYIFTTVGEEWGFVGSVVIIILFATLILRILHLAEHQKTKFSRVYGYCVAAILSIHFFVNIAMVIGIFPTIGVPLPFFSYGGSSLWAFTILLFIFLKLDANKVNEW